MIELLCDLLKTQGLNPKPYVEYHSGEMDVLCNRIYYEVKSSDKPRLLNKAKSQIARAMKYDKCDYGYLVTPTGVYDIMKDLVPDNCCNNLITTQKQCRGELYQYQQNQQSRKQSLQ